MTAVITEPVTRPTTTDGEGTFTHIVCVPDDSNMTATTYVLEAWIYGMPVVALCGHQWIPERDPKKYPVCQRCVEIYEQTPASADGMPDA